VARESPYAGGLRYAPGLDGLRAVAVAGVLLYHARVGWASGGFLGVDLFFVLSGYLITSLLLVEHRRLGGVDLLRFWAGRARRLLPAATLVIGVSVVVVAVFYRADFGRVRADALASFLYFNNWHQIVASHSYFAAFGRPSPLQHYWSVSLEEQFYLVWPLVLIAGLGRRRRGWLVLIAAALATGSAVLMGMLYHAGGDPSRVYYGTDTRAAPLMIGALLAFAWPMVRLTPAAGRGARLVLDGIGLAGLGTLALAIGTWPDYDPFLYHGGFVLAAVAAAAAIAAAAHPASHVARVLGAPPIRWIGQRSYGLYLWHWPVMVFSRPGIDLHWSSWALVPAQLTLTLALAALSYRYLEMPIRRGRAQAAARRWLDRHRPLQRLAALSGTVGLVAVAVAVVLILPAGRSAGPRRALSSLAASRSLGAAVAAPAASRPGRATGSGGVTGAGATSGLAGAGRLVGTGGFVGAGGPLGGVLAVGASVMLAAEPALEHRVHARVDAAVGRQPSAIIERLAAYRAAGLLPSRVVVQLGDNGPLWHAAALRLRQVPAGVRRVVLVNVREPTSWQAEVNQELLEAASAWPQATVADWWSASSNPQLLYDGAHPNDAGSAVYADVVAAALAGR
jgi:peptidoglycan/LPS O-acetylase OafA/YrhL